MKGFEINYFVETVIVENATLLSNFSEARSEAFRVAKEKKCSVSVKKQCFYHSTYIDNSEVEVLKINGAELYK